MLKDQWPAVQDFQRAIGWNDPAAGAPVSIYMLQAFEQLGIAEAMKAKTVAFKVRSDRFGAIARGDVEIGFNQISEIVAAPGVDLAGPLPAAIQNFTLLSTAIIASSSEKEAARSLIQFITSSRARELMRAKGFEDP